MELILMEGSVKKKFLQLAKRIGAKATEFG